MSSGRIVSTPPLTIVHLRLRLAVFGETISHFANRSQVVARRPFIPHQALGRQ